MHGHDDVEVDLHLVGDAFLDGEELSLMASVPAKEFGYGEEDGDEYKGNGSVASGRGATGVGRLGFRESIERPDVFLEAAFLLPKSALIQAMVHEAVHTSLLSSNHSRRSMQSKDISVFRGTAWPTVIKS